MTTLINNEMREVRPIQDQDSHWYLIPAELKQKFYELEEKGEADEFVEFTETFANYRTGGAMNAGLKLYVVNNDYIRKFE